MEEVDCRDNSARGPEGTRTDDARGPEGTRTDDARGPEGTRTDDARGPEWGRMAQEQVGSRCSLLLPNVASELTDAQGASARRLSLHSTSSLRVSGPGPATTGQPPAPSLLRGSMAPAGERGISRGHGARAKRTCLWLLRRRRPGLGFPR